MTKNIMTTSLKQSRSAKGLLGAPLYIRLTPDETTRVELHAANDMRSRASFLRRMVLLGLEQHERELATNQQ
jgi:hypothetical protein